MRVQLFYTQGMSQDWTDQVLEKWTALRTDLEMAPYQVTARVSRIALHVARQQEEAYTLFGLNRGEVGVLGALRVAGASNPLSPTRLFKGLMLSSAGITSRLDRLERRGLVRRTRDPNDRRGILVELTDEGKRVLEEAVTAENGSAHKLLGSLTLEERETLAELLRKLLADLEPNSSV
jgi:DNA-binding MarR family transcriptional regulator